MKSPIFIFSLPRSGSTLLQRILNSHRRINTSSEPWILLPLIYAFKEKGHLSEYSSYNAYSGIDNFVQLLPQNKNAVYNALSNAVKDLYQQHCQNGEIYFIDKTPRYFLIIEEIYKMFPEAKFIFLIRHPLSFFSSLINTWGNGGLSRLAMNDIELKEGLQKLVEGYKMIGSNSILIHYQDLVKNPKKTIEHIANYLELSINDFDVSTLQPRPTGEHGDATGVLKYDSISTDSLYSWEKTFNSYSRKRVANRFLASLDDEKMNTIGLDIKSIKEELKKVKIRRVTIIRDTFDQIISWSMYRLNIHLLFHKSLKWTKDRYLS